MRRSEFISFVGAALATRCAAAQAQPSKTPIVGFLSSFTAAQAAPALAEIRRGLAANGFADGTSVLVESRYADGQYDRLPGLVAELIARPVDVILASGRPAPFAATAATTRIPIVFVVSLDPVAAGLVDSLARPSGNITGITHLSDTLVQKRLEIGLELVRNASRVAILINPNTPDTIKELGALETMTRPRGLNFKVAEAATADQIETAFAALAASRPDLLLVGADPLYLSRAAQIAAAAARHALPAIYPFREFVAAGGLISYGAQRLHNYRQAGIYASRILKGARTSDLPVLQPTAFELLINLRTAQALGLAVPPTLQMRADEVTE